MSDRNQSLRSSVLEISDLAISRRELFASRFKDSENDEPRTVLSGRARVIASPYTGMSASDSQLVLALAFRRKLDLPNRDMIVEHETIPLHVLILNQ